MQDSSDWLLPHVSHFPSNWIVMVTSHEFNADRRSSIWVGTISSWTLSCVMNRMVILVMKRRVFNYAFLCVGERERERERDRATITPGGNSPSWLRTTRATAGPSTLPCPHQECLRIVLSFVFVPLLLLRMIHSYYHYVLLIVLILVLVLLLLWVVLLLNIL